MEYSHSRTVGPVSLNQASSCGSSTTETAAGRAARAAATCPGLAQTVTGSNSEMADATAVKAFCAGLMGVGREEKGADRGRGLGEGGGGRGESLGLLKVLLCADSPVVWAIWPAHPGH